MTNYTIKKAHSSSNNDNIKIVSKNLYYLENCSEFSGCQCSNAKNHNKIKDKCEQIVNLIREIENLNKI